MNRTETWFLVAALALAAWGLWRTASLTLECHNRGGTAVRGVWDIECIETPRSRPEPGGGEGEP